MMLTNRQLLILQLTVDDFIESAQPVGFEAALQKAGSSIQPCNNTE